MESRVCPKCGSRWYSAGSTSVWICEFCGAEIPRAEARLKDDCPEKAHTPPTIP